MRQNAEGQPIDPSKSTPELQSVAKYLLGGKYFKMNEAKFQGNRVDYFKGYFL